jgi:hypothetical protein
MKPFIIVEPQNPRSLNLEKLGLLLERFENIDPDVDILVSGEGELKGYGVTWWEVLHIWLPLIASGGAVHGAAKITAEKVWGKIVDGMIDGVTDWIRERHKDPDNTKRPVSVHIYGPKGEVLKDVEWQGPDFEPVEKDVKGQKALRKRPKKMGVESMPTPIYYDPNSEKE